MTGFIITDGLEIRFVREIREMGDIKYVSIPKEVWTKLKDTPYAVTLKPSVEL